VIDVIDAVITAQGENIMTSLIEEAEATQTSAVAERKPTKKRPVRAERANVAPKKAKSGKKATPR
jgi:hypothetical protein